MEYDWKLINSFAPWLSAIGTLLAVITSLYLARRENPKLRVTTSVQVLISEAIEGNPKYFIIEIVNIGIRPVKITGVGWTIGLFKKKSFIQMVGKDSEDLVSQMYSSDYPVTLNDGEEAKWLIPLDRDNNWIDGFKNNFSWCPRWDMLFTNLEVFTSHGMKHKERIGETVRKELLEAIKKEKEER